MPSSLLEQAIPGSHGEFGTMGPTANSELFVQVLLRMALNRGQGLTPPVICMPFAELIFLKKT